MAKARPQLDKMANGKKKPMSRTSGVAGRKLGRSEGIATKLKYGAPLTGSASGVKSISLKDAGEVLTSGIVTLGKKGLQADPASLAMALPVGKVLKAAQALKAAGKIGKATALFARLDAKNAGQVMGEFGNITQGVAQGRPLRKLSESVFPRLPDNSIPGTARTFDTYADPLLEGAGRFKGKDDLSDFVSGAGILGGMRKVGKAAGKSKAFGRAAAKEVAKNAKTPKMTPQQAQDSYERVADLIKGGRAAKRRGK